MLRLLAVPTLTAAAVTLAACGDDDDEVAEPTPAIVDDVTAAGIRGLEVTAAGDVSEVIDPFAFRIDKDGLDAGVEPDIRYDYDFDYYDSDLTFDDEAFGDDAFDEGMLVLKLAGTQVEQGDEVRVSGTIRQFDQELLELTYGIDLDDTRYGPFEDLLVLVADTVEPAETPAANGSDTGAPTTPPDTTQSPAPTN